MANVKSFFSTASVYNVIIALYWSITLTGRYYWCISSSCAKMVLLMGHPFPILLRFVADCLFSTLDLALVYSM